MLARTNITPGTVSQPNACGPGCQQRMESYTSNCAFDAPNRRYFLGCRYVRHAPGESFDGQLLAIGLCTQGATGSTEGDFSFPQLTCATRPRVQSAVPGDVSAMCFDGCRYTPVGVSVTLGDPPTTAGSWSPTGETCTPTPDQPAPPVRPDPSADSDSDGVPDSQDERPTDPGCAIGCGPRPGEEAPPSPPNDNQDDGAQVAAQLGPKLDRIEQAVLGLGPKMDSVKAAVDGARGDANADADRMVSAIDAVAAAVRAQGPNVPGQPGEPGGDGEEWDWSPRAPGPDGGDLPNPSTVIENADAAALMAQLDQDGWSLSRSCPATRWSQSFDLGWGSFDMAMPINIVCTALAILGWVIGLAGLIQASFILSRIGQN